MPLEHRRLRCLQPVESRCLERVSTRSKPDDGFTLVEVLIATTILVVGLVAIAQLLVLTASMQQLSRTSTDTARLAQRKVDELLLASWNPADPDYSLGIEISPANTLTANVANYFETRMADPGVVTSGNYDIRWRVAAGPTATTRFLTVRVVPNVATIDFRRVRGGGAVGQPTNAVELTTLLRQP